MVALSNSGSFNGVKPLGAISGCGISYPPHWAVIVTNGIATTATRLYYIPYYFEEVRAFTGIRTENFGAADNGDTYRCGVYQATLLSTGSRGGPGALIADCGQVTLTGASAIRTLASSFTPAYVGWHWLAFATNLSATMSSMSNASSTAANGYGSPMYMGFGVSSISIATAGTQTFGALYVDTTYGALASTAVAPTALTAVAPTIAPYLT